MVSNVKHWTLLGAVMIAAAFGLLAASAGAMTAWTVRRDATVREQQVAERIAFVYWARHAPAQLTDDGRPLCGSPRISWRALSPSGDAAAEAMMDGSCRIVFNTAGWVWPAAIDRRGFVSSGDTWSTFCAVMVHEIGHLVLGPDYFAATNPDDPAHSADPESVMFADITGLEVPACMNTPDPAASWEHVAGPFSYQYLH